MTNRSFARLHADLAARGFDVWWDRVARPARGLTFLHEIRDAIDYPPDRQEKATQTVSEQAKLLCAEWAG